MNDNVFSPDKIERGIDGSYLDPVAPKSEVGIGESEDDFIDQCESS